MSKKLLSKERFLVKKKHYQFSCHNCGAAISYRIGSKKLVCNSCGHVETIDDDIGEIREYSLAEALHKLEFSPLHLPACEVRCHNCGATFTWDSDTLSDLCDYCQMPIAKQDTEHNRIQTEAIVPFSIEESEAFSNFTQWIRSRWLAPNVLKQMAGHSKQFEGIYIPHWTFDSITHTDYRGLRGENYVEYTNSETKIPIRKIRWYRAAGRVRVAFDDVLVLASLAIPRAIVNNLSPWHLSKAEPYTPEYLAGMQAQYYQLNLDKAYEVAKNKMQYRITAAIRRDIGGDHQRIKYRQTHYQNSTYKLIMLPVWHSAFEYKGKAYKTIVNGQTGKVAGEYPKSPIKVTLLIIALVIIVIVAGYFLSLDQQL